MNTKLNKSDWIILGIIYGVTVLFNAFDYNRQDNKLIEYLVDFPTTVLLSIIIILIFVQFLVPKLLIEKKKYIYFVVFGIITLSILGTLENIIGTLTAGKSLSGIANIITYLKKGLYNGTDMVGFPLAILLIKKF